MHKDWKFLLKMDQLQNASYQMIIEVIWASTESLRNFCLQKEISEDLVKFNSVIWKTTTQNV